MPHPGLLHPQLLPLWQATADMYLCRRHSSTVLSRSLWVSGSWCTQGLFGPSECLWLEWGLILNMILPLLLSFWGFSFDLGCGLSSSAGIQHSPVDGCSAVSCNFGVLAREDEHTFFYSAIFLYLSSCGAQI